MVMSESEKMFHKYRTTMEHFLQVYGHIKTRFPHEAFPSIAAQIWRNGMLAEMWGTIATMLSPTKRNYLREWREGK